MLQPQGQRPRGYKPILRNTILIPSETGKKYTMRTQGKDLNTANSENYCNRLLFKIFPMAHFGLKDDLKNHFETAILKKMLKKYKKSYSLLTCMRM